MHLPLPRCPQAHPAALHAVGQLPLGHAAHSLRRRVPAAGCAVLAVAMLLLPGALLLMPEVPGWSWVRWHWASLQFAPHASSRLSSAIVAAGIEEIGVQIEEVSEAVLWARMRCFPQSWHGMRMLWASAGMPWRLHAVAQLMSDPSRLQSAPQPFSILPLCHICHTIRRNVEELLEEHSSGTAGAGMSGGSGKPSAAGLVAAALAWQQAPEQQPAALLPKE